MLTLLNTRNRDRRELSTTIACALGESPALILDRVHSWIVFNRDQDRKLSTHYHYGMWWTYNTLKNWHEQDFPWMSFDTVRNVFAKLEALRILFATAEFNDKPTDRTKWYTLNIIGLNAFFLLWHHCGCPLCGVKGKKKAARESFDAQWNQVKLPTLEIASSVLSRIEALSMESGFGFPDFSFGNNYILERVIITESNEHLSASSCGGVGSPYWTTFSTLLTDAVASVGGEKSSSSSRKFKTTTQKQDPPQAKEEMIDKTLQEGSAARGYLRAGPRGRKLHLPESQERATYPLCGVRMTTPLTVQGVADGDKIKVGNETLSLCQNCQMYDSLEPGFLETICRLAYPNSDAGQVLSQNFAMVRRTAGQMRSVDAEVSVSDLEAFEQWWYKHTGNGHFDRPPKFHQIGSEWQSFRDWQKGGGAQSKQVLKSGVYSRSVEEFEEDLR
jgi:hypothetical protein